LEQVEIQTKYEGYIQRQQEEIARMDRLRGLRLPHDFSYEGIPGLSREVIEKLSRIRPTSLDQASRISGITPAALSILSLYLKKREHVKKSLPPPDKQAVG
jgi:tRNA uridine 5-carboxymethylaminomethyl modification enzyme